jgi:hypothetical protein
MDSCDRLTIAFAKAQFKVEYRGVGKKHGSIDVPVSLSMNRLCEKMSLGRRLFVRRY